MPKNDKYFKSFDLKSDYKPSGDQPQAIKLLTQGIKDNEKAQTLLGVTGSGKTFTIANVVANINKPMLVVSHNKTLAAQLYQEFRDFFPNNKVEYFVSYYDYYQPESYLPVSDTYIAKDLSINAQIEKLRISTTVSLASKRNDVIVVSSVSCIYGVGNPETFEKSLINLKKNDKVSQKNLLFRLVDLLYKRAIKEFSRGTFRVKGDTVDIFPAYADIAYRLIFWGNEIESLDVINPETGHKISEAEDVNIFPANLFVTNKDDVYDAIKEIQKDLKDQIRFFESSGLEAEVKRILERTELDIEMIKEIGYCSGIENYSRYFDKREEGQRPFCLIDYFPKDYLMVIDESHVTLPQIRAMYAGDRARKLNLVQHGFRLPSAMDNRPLKVEEFEQLINQVIYVSATPSQYEIEQSHGVVVEQIIRPTGLLDPKIEVRPSENQIDDLLHEIKKRISKKERVLITTLTKIMAEELSKYLSNLEIKCTYIHSDVKTLDRTEIMDNLRRGIIDVLIGINLLREGLDLPEVSLVIILDADKEGFLRSIKSLIQTIGRAARNKEGKVIMYADRITDSMEHAIEETSRRRLLQMDYNKKHNISPTTIIKKFSKGMGDKYYAESDVKFSQVADPALQYIKKEDIKEIIKELEQQMKIAAKQENFIEAIRLRDEIGKYRDML